MAEGQNTKKTAVKRGRSEKRQDHRRGATAEHLAALPAQTMPNPQNDGASAPSCPQCFQRSSRRERMVHSTSPSQTRNSGAVRVVCALTRVLVCG